MPAVPRFWRMIPNRYNLLGTKCKNCGRVFFPPRSICPDCRRVGNVETYKLDGKGEIISYTHVRSPQEDFEEETPYTIAIIELDEGPRIVGQITDTDGGDIEIGKKVKTTFRNIGEDGNKGIIHYGYKFQLTK